MTTPQELIATAILDELRTQFDSDDNKGTIGWIDSTSGTADVVLDGRFDLDKVGEAIIDLGRLPGDWRCFHCDQVLYTEDAARAHFGPHEGRTPACQIKATEGGLIRALREAEEEAEKAWGVVHSEGADGLMAWRGAMSRNDSAVRSAEETGYARGILDQAKAVETLRRALAWHGDPQRMATTREEWQQEIDEAIRWVKDNPENDRPSFPSFRSPPSASDCTYAVQHNPNCPNPYLVRLPRGILDFKAEGLSTDAIGYGLTFLEAFAAAQEKLAKPAPTQADVIGGLLDQARAL